jgi:hypothetical protein
MIEFEVSGEVRLLNKGLLAELAAEGSLPRVDPDHGQPEGKPSYQPLHRPTTT